MSSPFRKIQKNAEDFEIKNYFQRMTPQMYQEGIQMAIKKTEETLLNEYNLELKKMSERYNKSLREATLIAMDTLAVEMVYELGNILNCYDKEPEYLDQKIDVIHGIYETAMNSIEDYASHKYKNDKQVQRVFAKKKKIVQKLFGMEARDGSKKN